MLYIIHRIKELSRGFTVAVGTGDVNRAARQAHELVCEDQSQATANACLVDAGAITAPEAVEDERKRPALCPVTQRSAVTAGSATMISRTCSNDSASSEASKSTCIPSLSRSHPVLTMAITMNSAAIRSSGTFTHCPTNAAKTTPVVKTWARYSSASAIKAGEFAARPARSSKTLKTRGIIQAMTTPASDQSVTMGGEVAAESASRAIS